MFSKLNFYKGVQYNSLFLMVIFVVIVCLGCNLPKTGQPMISENKDKTPNNIILSSMLGQWEGKVSTWLEKDKLADTSNISGTIRSTLDGSFVMYEYTAGYQGKDLKGIAMFGFQNDQLQFNMTWMDTFHMGTGIMLSEGDKKPTDSFFTVLGSYADSSGGPRWGWRTSVEIKDNNHTF